MKHYLCCSRHKWQSSASKNLKCVILQLLGGHEAVDVGGLLRHFIMFESCTV